MWFQYCICDACGEEGCSSGGMLSLVKHGNAILFIPVFDIIDTFEEYDFDGAGDSSCPPHQWYEEGILVLEGEMAKQLLSTLSGLSLEKIPDVTERELDLIFDWENLVKEKPKGFMNF